MKWVQSTQAGPRSVANKRESFFIYKLHDHQSLVIWQISWHRVFALYAFWNSMSTAIQTRLHPRFRNRSNMLASVKEGLYHPMLPTFRRMDMDTAGHKLPEEHSRTTTPLTKGTLTETWHGRQASLPRKRLIILIFFFQTILEAALSRCSGQLINRCQAR